MKETLKLALEALRDIIEGNRIDDVGNRNDDGLTDHDGRHDFKKRIANAYEALQVGKQALAQEQEPVAWRYRGNLHEFDPSDWAEGPVTPLYTTPPQRKPLTNEQISAASKGHMTRNGFARAIETIHGIGDKT